MYNPKNLLKYINSIPFDFTVKHYQMFGDGASVLKNNALDSVESWDSLRLNHPHFSIPDTRERWLDAVEVNVTKDGQDKALISRARDISSIISKRDIHSLFSAGVGGAGLEYQIKKHIPNIPLFCSEYSLQNVSILKKVFTECDEIIFFDILRGDWRDIQKKYIGTKDSLLLMYRLDAGFTNEEWKSIFKSIYDSGVENILYIPTTLLTFRSLWNRKSRELKWLVTHKKISCAGHLRSKKTFESFWSTLYETENADFGGLKGFLLTRIDKKG